MDTGDGSMVRRKASVNTLLLKTLHLSQTLGAETSVPVPERILRRTQSDQLKHGSEGGHESDRRGRKSARLYTDRGPRNTERSIREMIYEIETRAKGGMSSPRFAQSIECLGPEHLDWHKGRKSPRRSRSPSPTRAGESSCFMTSRPVVNIIGCQQSTELILSRADDRIRRQLAASELRDEVCRKQRERILQMIAAQESKAQRVKEDIRRQQLQSGWLKILVICAFVEQFQPMVEDELGRARRNNKILYAGMRVAHNVASWHQRKHAQRYLAMFRNVLASKSSMFLVRLRIIYKRQCCKRIKSFFTEIKDRTKVSNMVHKFLQSVRLIQKAIRNFIACRLEKIRSTIIIWDRLEMQYIKVGLFKKMFVYSSLLTTRISSIRKN
jgi:hypothetical protein